MALERKPQNLRGYGLAQDPKVELDTTFVDDQNRRAYQQKGIEAQQEAQQKNFAQRDKETRVDLLKGIPTIESNWSPEIKSKINAEIDAFIKGAGDLSTEEIVVGLNGLKSKAGAYKSIGTALKDRATKVATGEIYSGLDGDKLLGLKLEKDFANLTFEEAMTKAMNITQSQFAPMPDMTQWETLKNNVYDFAKSSSTGEMEYAGNLGDKSYGRFGFKVDPNAKKAAASNFMTGNRGFYNLYAEKNELDFDKIESTLSSEINDMVFGKWGENSPPSGNDNDNNFGEPEVRPKAVQDPEGLRKDAQTYVMDFPRDLTERMQISPDDKNPQAVTDGFPQGFRMTADGDIVADITYKVKNKDAGEGEAQTLNETKSMKADEFMKAQASKLGKGSKKYKALQKYYSDFKRDAKVEGGEFDYESVMIKSSSEGSGNITGAKASEKIFEELEKEGIEVTDKNNDPRGTEDISFSVNGKPFRYNFDLKRDRDKFLKDKNNGFKKETSNGKPQFN